MRRNFSEILSNMDARELDTLLDGIPSDPVDPTVADRLKAQVCAKTGISKKRSYRRVISALAACLALAILVGFGSYAYAAEVKEYNAAITFFDEYGLSTEGLTRSEIKAVYRDITTEAFSYSKTVEVIERSTDLVDGYEIPQEDPTPEDVARLWQYRNEHGWYLAPAPSSGVYYDLYQGVFSKYDGEKMLWSVDPEEFSVTGYNTVSDGVIIFGTNYEFTTGNPSYSWMEKLDPDGNRIWIQKVGGSEDDIVAVLENDDGTLAVISRVGLYVFCLRQCNADGNVTYLKQTNIGNYGIWDAARFGDGYLIQLGNFMDNTTATIVMVDREGNLGESFSYSSEDAQYHITDMIEFDGKIYLSAYAAPIGTNGSGHSEIASVLDYLFSNDMWEIESEELTPMVRDIYTAMLLVCDPEVGTPQEFYSVKGSLGGTLAISDSGELLWDVESITTTFFSPSTSSFTIGGISYVYRYTFNESGSLVSQEKTGQTVDFRR